MHCQQELSGFTLATPDARHRRPLKFFQRTLFFSIILRKLAYQVLLKSSQRDASMVAFRRFRSKRR
jgi:hypothetical protein